MTPSTESDSTSRSLMGRFSVLLGAHGFREALQALFLILLARQSPGTYGDLMLAFSMGSIVLSAMEFGLNQHLVSRLPLRTHDPGALLLAYTVIKGLLFLCAWPCVLLAALAQGYPATLTILVMVLATGFGMEGIASSFFSFLRYQGRQREEGGIKAAAAVVGFAYGFVMLGLRAAGVLLGVFKLIESLINAALSAFRAFPTLPTRAMLLSWRDVRRLFMSSLVFVLIALAASLYNKLNAIVLYRVGGAEALAQYSATWSNIEWVTALVSNLMLGAVLFPLLARLHVEDRARLSALVRNAFRWLLLAALPVTFVAVVESDRIVGLIYGPRYLEAIQLQKILAFAIPLGFLHNLAVYLMLGTGHERRLLAFNGSGLLLSAVLCGILIPARPLEGAAAAILLVKGAVAVLTVGFCQRRFGLVDGRTLGAVFTVGVAMAGLYWLGGMGLPREVAESGALIPPCLLAWHWRRMPPVDGTPRP